MRRFCVVLYSAKPSVKIPKINALGQWHAALAFDVLANFVLDGFQHTVRVLAFNVQLECFFHDGALSPHIWRDALAP